jgi:hypothetical protein
MIMDILHDIAVEEGRVSTRRCHFHEFMLDIHSRCHELRVLREEAKSERQKGDNRGAFVDVPEKLAQLRGARQNDGLLRRFGLLAADDPLWKIGHDLSAETSFL